ncbi:MAG: TetR/AcrR family transcriptional regulator [Solirubrobacterales bacterium]|jgi:AcrR family transcriptional regulator|nr:TetR/AcrR family transcriptional regulator [Solirubrobacterales bacterium]
MASAQPSTAKRAQVQQAVLAATEELLGAGGSFQDLKIEKIATAAGISRTAFYFYFKDKRELLMRLAEDVTGELYGRADSWFSGDEGAPEDQVSEALSAIAKLYFEHGPLLRAIVEVSTYDEEIAVFWRALLQRFADATEHRITTEQAAGRSPEMPAGPTAFALVWMTERTFYQQMVQGAPAEPGELVAALNGIWIRAVYGT